MLAPNVSDVSTIVHFQTLVLNMDNLAGPLKENDTGIQEKSYKNKMEKRANDVVSLSLSMFLLIILILEKMQSKEI